MKRVTVVDSPRAIVAPSGFAPGGGGVTFGEWCRHEVARLCAKGIRAEVRGDPEDGAAVCVWAAVPGDPGDEGGEA